MINKLEVGPPSPHLCSPSGYHGGRRGAADLAMRARGISEEALKRSKSTEVELADVTCGRRRPLRVAAFGRRRSIFFLQAKMPKRRIFDLIVTSIADGNPSGVVPGVADGGRHSGSTMSTRSGGEEGLDRVSRLLFTVFLVNVEGMYWTGASL